MVDAVQVVETLSPDAIDTVTPNVEPVAPAENVSGFNAALNTPAVPETEPGLPPVVELSEPGTAENPSLTEQLAAHSDLMRPTLGERLVARAFESLDRFATFPHSQVSAEGAAHSSVEPSIDNDLIVTDTAATGSESVSAIETVRQEFDNGLQAMAEANQEAVEQVREFSQRFVDVAVWSAGFELTTSSVSKSTQGLNKLLSNQ